MGILGSIGDAVGGAVDAVTGGGSDDSGSSSSDSSSSGSGSAGSGYSNTSGSSGGSSGSSSSDSSSSGSGSAGSGYSNTSGSSGGSSGSSSSGSSSSGSGSAGSGYSNTSGSSGGSSGSSSSGSSSSGSGSAGSGYSNTSGSSGGSSGSSSSGSSSSGSGSAGSGYSNTSGSSGGSSGSSSSDSSSSESNPAGSGYSNTSASSETSATDDGIANRVRETASDSLDRAREVGDDVVDTATGVASTAGEVAFDPFERAADFVRDDANDGPGRPEGIIDTGGNDRSITTKDRYGSRDDDSVQTTGPSGASGTLSDGINDPSQLSDQQRERLINRVTADSPFGSNDVVIDQLEIGSRPDPGEGIDEALSQSEQQRLREEAAADSIFTADQIAIESVSQTDDGARVDFATPETNVDVRLDEEFNNAQTFADPGGRSTQQGFGMPASATTPRDSGGTQKLDKVSEIAGRDITVEQGETFGDAQELEPLDQFFGDLADNTFETAKAAGDIIGSRVEDSVRLSVSASPTTGAAGDDLFDGDNQPRTGTGKAVSGAVQAGSFPFAIPKKAVEGVEAGVYVADDPERISEAPGKASDLLLSSAEGAANNPAEATGALVASGGASSALFKATQGTRFGTASRLTLQPGEEALKAGFRATGRAPDRPATAAQMVGEQINLDTSGFLKDRRGQSQIGRQRSSSKSDSDVSPEIGGEEIISDPFDSSPVRSEFRDRARIEPETAEIDRLRDQTASIDLRERFDSPRTSEPLFGGSIEGSARSASLVAQAQSPEVAADVGSFGQTGVRQGQRLETALGLETETDVLSRLESETELATAVESETETTTETALKLETATETELGLESEFAFGSESESEFSVDFDESEKSSDRGGQLTFGIDDDLFSTGISNPDDVLDDLGF